MATPPTPINLKDAVQRPIYDTILYMASGLALGEVKPSMKIGPEDWAIYFGSDMAYDILIPQADKTQYSINLLTDSTINSVLNRSLWIFAIVTGVDLVMKRPKIEANLINIFASQLVGNYVSKLNATYGK